MYAAELLLPCRTPALGWLVALACLLCSALRADVCLVRDGRPHAEIVVSAQAARIVRLAANDLQTYIRKITGAELPVTAERHGEVPAQVYVGRSAYTDELGISASDLQYGAFRIVANGNYLVLLGDDSEFVPPELWPDSPDADGLQQMQMAFDARSGGQWGNPLQSLGRRYNAKLDLWEGDGRGSFNAVSEFLRSLGVRWYYPGELGEVVPHADTITVPPVSREVRPDFPLRHFFFYYNEFFMASEEEIQWQLHLNLQPYPEILGHVLGHGTTLVHGREEVKQAHPEYFAIWGGQRVTEHLGGAGAPCLSAEGLLQDNIRFARAVFDLLGEPGLSVAPSDGYVDLCECPLCVGKDTPQRGWYGRLSDYVWGYVNRVAEAVWQTHPDRKITGLAYTAYQLPPEQLAALSPNVVVGLCYWRTWMQDPAERERLRNLQQAWLAKLPSRQLFVWDYFLHARPDGAYVGIPVYFPHLLADDLRTLRGVSLGDHVEIYRNWPPDGHPWDALAANHLNCYVASRLYWDVNLDLEGLLTEYFNGFYGPASTEMRRFVEYAEANWQRATTDYQVLDRMQELLAAARTAAGENNVYARRVELLEQFMAPTRELRERLAKGRSGNPQARALQRDASALKLDGILEEDFWQGLPPYDLTDLVTGAPPRLQTSLRLAWTGDSLCVGVRCQEPDTEGLPRGTGRPDDTGIWNADNVEILIETQSHAYYQIAISPSGDLVDADRARGIDTLWSSGVEVATHIGAGYWSLELRLPVVGKSDDPLQGVVGRRPTPTYPWYFNVCRQRLRGAEKELTAFAPTGKPSFHETMKFAELIVP